MRTRTLPTNPAMVSITLLTRDEVAEAISISPHTLSLWVKRRTFPEPIKIGPRREHRWRLVDIQIWIQQTARKPAPKVELRGAVKQRQQRKVVRVRLPPHLRLVG